jgi:Domain of unknown function (DUF4168)
MNAPIRLLTAAFVAAAPLAAAPALAQAQTPSPQLSAPSQSFSNQKLDSVASAMRSVAGVKRNYQRQLNDAAPSDQERIIGEARRALEKAVTDQGLTVDEYQEVLEVAQDDQDLRNRLLERLTASGSSRPNAEPGSED